MTIQPLTASQTSAGAAAAAPSPPTDVNENEFLTLLVAQIKNQDPTNPTDSTQFVTQLAQFSELEQMIAIRSDIESQMASTTQNTGSTTGSTQGGN